MLLYNVTVKIDRDAEQEWLEWMKQKHIPDVMSSGQFAGSHICKLLDQPEDDDTTYVIQYRCESRENYEFYLKNFAPALQDEYNARYKGKFVAFRTLMEIV
ncbi:MAG TPA: DUF4286 family protein [Chitinophagales bacterium]|nr:DUF4286 family protein [Chitinophagales bacterium]